MPRERWSCDDATRSGGSSGRPSSVRAVRPMFAQRRGTAGGRHSGHESRDPASVDPCFSVAGGVLLACLPAPRHVAEILAYCGFRRTVTLPPTALSRNLVRKSQPTVG